MRGLRVAAGWLRRGKAAWSIAEDACARCYSTALPDSLLPVVAIIGRPNVGKSALFNRLVRRREAVVHDTPGGHVTRDYQEGVARLADLRFRVIDTSGLEPFLPGDSIQARATVLTATVLARSDIALFLVDGSTGTLPADEELARWLRKTVVGPGATGPAARSCAVLLAANKCERRGGGGAAAVAAAVAESMRLGLGEPVALSAMTGEGMTDLYAALQPLLDPLTEARRAAVQQIEAPSGSGSTDIAGYSSSDGSDGISGMAAAAAPRGLGGQGAAVQQQAGGGEWGKEDPKTSNSGGGSSVPLRIAIMGLPNVGKSTLANWLLGSERCLTGPEPGLTRDAIKERIEWEGQEVELVDTAGWIRRTKLANYDESGGAVAQQTVAEARGVMQFVHAVALLVDAARCLELGQGLTHREITLASDVVAEGRLLLIVANKLDTLTPAKRQHAMRLVREAVEDNLPDVSGVPIIGMSAMTGEGVGMLLPAAAAMYRRWNQRVPTSHLNRWKAAEYQVGGGQVLNRITYISQVKARPPTFVAWVSGSTALSAPSQRFVAAQIRKEFGFGGVPIRIAVRLKQPRRQKRAR
ncbi:hypothetical protein CHLNCDRAFT_144853 [Chlorella variabilis]|uniref:GTPase Der n=1 Tax=Chlorella variabilis TaxID=554065 RepID=E1ZD60_CHLVA|nr:hypothetical protein CHLNCDRAFT_144853 [Chlorella variabilis]EFN56363.1 hypothetical protein CHLNCDRAFT_144853 [Chlorella variabilis]|eukprot:XP_005848465.1 hypothetical protein CHLNCDRAFT_144853 [Chlorella variabilis]